MLRQLHSWVAICIPESRLSDEIQPTKAKWQSTHYLRVLALCNFLLLAFKIFHEVALPAYQQFVAYPDIKMKVVLGSVWIAHARPLVCFQPNHYFLRLFGCSKSTAKRSKTYPIRWFTIFQSWKWCCRFEIISHSSCSSFKPCNWYFVDTYLN